MFENREAEARKSVEAGAERGSLYGERFISIYRGVRGGARSSRCNVDLALGSADLWFALAEEILSYGVALE